MKYYVKIIYTLIKLFKKNKERKQNESFIFKEIARQTLR